MSLANLNYNDRLEHLLTELITERQNLPVKLRSPRNMTVSPASMGFVSAAASLIITGAAGTGKTYLSCVPGAEACKQTLRTCYIRMPDMPGHFQNHKDNLREQVRYRKRPGNSTSLSITGKSNPFSAN